MGSKRRKLLQVNDENTANSGSEEETSNFEKFEKLLFKHIKQRKITQKNKRSLKQSQKKVRFENQDDTVENLLPPQSTKIFRELTDLLQDHLDDKKLSRK